MKDGTIKDLDGTQDPDFVLCLNDHLYIVVFHRNHLSVISSISPPIMNGICTYDFSLDKNQVLGGSMGYKKLPPESGVWQPVTAMAMGTLTILTGKITGMQLPGSEDIPYLIFRWIRNLTTKTKTNCGILTVNFIRRCPIENNMI